jgi:opacity protein-like surface antigen
MERFLLAGVVALGLAIPAAAADLPASRPAPAPYVVPPFFNWTGCYVGVEGGGNWGRSEQVARSGPFGGSSITGTFDLSGGIAGGTVGCNYQLGSTFVIGIENDISWTDKKGSAVDQPPFDPAATSSTRERSGSTPCAAASAWLSIGSCSMAPAAPPSPAPMSWCPIPPPLAASATRRAESAGQPASAANGRPGPVPGGL